MHLSVTKPEHTLSFGVMGTQVTPVVTGTDSGSWEMFRLDLTPGARSPHHELSADKVFSVTSGTVQITVGDRAEDVTAGGYVHIPAGTPHHYANVSDAPASMTTVVSGAGQIEFLRGMGALTAWGKPDRVALAQHTGRYGVRLLAAAG